MPSLLRPLFTIVIPIFGLILAGYLLRRTGRLGPNASSEINRFVVYLALPALLFDIMANTHWATLYQPRFIAVFGLSTGAVFVATLAVRLKQARHLADASIEGLNAAYPNTGFIGLPLCLLVFGRDSLAPAVIATIMTVCVLFAFAIVLIEGSVQAVPSRSTTLLKVGRSLACNPLLFAPLAGALWAAGGLSMPQGAESFLKLIGGAASPCALVALGLFLAEKRDKAPRDTVTASLLVVMKLVAHPLLAWVLAFHVFSMPPLWAASAVLLSALPTGTGSFMLAEFYRREAAITSTTILLSTLVSVFTITMCLTFLPR
jgi:malonate transporter and related proteins